MNIFWIGILVALGAAAGFVVGRAYEQWQSGPRDPERNLWDAQ
jgi:hypothetical protein